MLGTAILNCMLAVRKKPQYKRKTVLLLFRIRLHVSEFYLVCKVFPLIDVEGDVFNINRCH